MCFCVYHPYASGMVSKIVHAGVTSGGGTPCELSGEERMVLFSRFSNGVEVVSCSFLHLPHLPFLKHNNTLCHRCGSIKASSGHTYLPMPCPVREGQPYYVDKPATVITYLPPELVTGGDIGSGDEGGMRSEAGGERRAGVLLSGIMTHSKDRGLSGIRAFLTFTLDKPAVVRG